jgi:hypothetical protein
MITRHRIGPRLRIGAGLQRGMVLFIALIVMVMMSLAAIGLMSAVDTTNLAVGNLAFRQASVLPANYAVEQAAATLFADVNKGGPMIADVKNNNAALNYYSTHAQVGWDNKYGIPLPLQTKSGAKALTVQYTDKDPNTGQVLNTITYVIERMCNPAAPVIPGDFKTALTWCDMMPPKQSTGTTANDQDGIKFDNVPFYRVTVRVDGPQNTTSFVQAMLR